MGKPGQIVAWHKFVNFQLKAEQDEGYLSASKDEMGSAEPVHRREENIVDESKDSVKLDWLGNKLFHI